MGTYVSILKFRSKEVRDSFRIKLLELAENSKGRPITYKSFKVRIGDNTINAELKIRFNVQTALKSSPAIINIEVDTPVELENLDGTWDVKEKKDITLFFYEDDEELSDIALGISDGSKGIRSFMEAIPHLHLPPPQRIKLRFARTPEFVDKISQLGSLGWVSLSRIRDRSLKAAGLWGQDLQSSEIVSDLLKRGAEVVSLVVVNDRKGLKIVVSNRGSIYSQRKLDPSDAARDLRELIKFFKSSNLFVFE